VCGKCSRRVQPSRQPSSTDNDYNVMPGGAYFVPTMSPPPYDADQPPAYATAAAIDLGETDTYKTASGDVSAKSPAYDNSTFATDDVLRTSDVYCACHYTTVVYSENKLRNLKTDVQQSLVMYSPRYNNACCLKACFCCLVYSSTFAPVNLPRNENIDFGNFLLGLLAIHCSLT